MDRGIQAGSSEYQESRIGFVDDMDPPLAFHKLQSRLFIRNDSFDGLPRDEES